MYAVVIFLQESTDDSKVVSEVPISWLSEDKKQCKWPPTGSNNNVNIYISKNRQPLEEWPSHLVEVECLCDSYKEAKIKAAQIKSQSDIEDEVKTGSGRAVRPRNYFSPSEFKTEKRVKVLSTIRLPPNNHVTIDHDDNLESNDDYIDHGYEEMNYLSNVNNFTQVPSDQFDSPPDNGDILALTTDTNVADDVCSPESERSDGLVSCRCETDLKKIIDLLADHTFILKSIQESLNITKPDGKLDSVEFNLPLTSLNDIDGIEQKLLSDKKTISSFYDIVMSIGGNGGKDYTNRSMSILLTNDVAELCSWTGARNNYELQNKKFIAILYRAVNKRTGFTAKEFETGVKDWLRHARQRKERAAEKTKKKSNIYSILPENAETD